MSSRRSRNLSPANLEIMKVIWEKGEVTVNDVFEIINSRRKHKLRRTTVQVQMNRLEEYGWLSHRAEGRALADNPKGHPGRYKEPGFWWLPRGSRPLSSGGRGCHRRRGQRTAQADKPEP